MKRPAMELSLVTAPLAICLTCSMSCLACSHTTQDDRAATTGQKCYDKPFAVEAKADTTGCRTYSNPLLLPGFKEFCTTGRLHSFNIYIPPTTVFKCTGRHSTLNDCM